MNRTNVATHIVAGAAAFALSAAAPAFAEVTFDWVAIGNPGNPADPASAGSIPGIGSVARTYRIARHEVTNQQYAAFLNAVAATDTNGVYNPAMETDPRGGIMRSGSPGSFTYSVKPDMEDKPVNYVSFFDAMRFVNWLHNGQPTGTQGSTTTEDGVYAISDGLSETRAVDARFFLPTESEWYKAAYHHPATEGGDGDDYWDYAIRTNNIPTLAAATADGEIANPGPNVANYSSGADWNGQNGSITTVGSAGPLAGSFYGTADQAGNVWEWNEAVVNGSSRGARGGSFSSVLGELLASNRFYTAPSTEGAGTGFRVASPAIGVEIPAVSQWGLAAMLLLILSAGTVVCRRRTSQAG